MQKLREAREAEEHRRKTEEIFRGMAKAQETSQKQGPVKATNFESIMQEEATRSRKQLEEEKKIEEIRSAQNQNMKFNWIDKEDIPAHKNTIAADTKPDF